jgi:hypothetical protein
MVPGPHPNRHGRDEEGLLKFFAFAQSGTTPIKLGPGEVRNLDGILLKNIDPSDREEILTTVSWLSSATGMDSLTINIIRDGVTVVRIIKDNNPTPNSVTTFGGGVNETGVSKSKPGHVYTLQVVGGPNTTFITDFNISGKVIKENPE